MKLHVIAARQRLPPSILRRRARYAMASSRSGRAPPAAIPQGRGASLLARFPSTSARHPAGRATHPAPVLRLRPPPSRRGAPRPHLPDFRLRPPASPQGALHILRQFSACARRRPAGARAVHHSPDFHLRPPPFRRGAVRPYLPDFRLHPPAIRRGARGTSFTGFPPAPAASPQGRGASLLARFPSTSARHPAGARAVRHSPDFRLRPPPARRGALRAIPQDGFRHSHGQQRRGRHGPSAVELARCGSAHFTVSAHSPGYAAAAFAPCASPAQATKRASRQQFAPPCLPLGRRGGGSLSLRFLTQ